MAGNKPSRKPVGNWSGRHNVRRRPQPHQGPLASWINQHKHAIRFSLKRLWFNPVSTWITLAAIAIALSLPASLSLLLTNMQTLTDDKREVPTITAFMKENISEQQTKDRAELLQELSEIANVQVVTRDQALADFKNITGFAETLETLDENPLPHVMILTPNLERFGDDKALQTFADRLKSYPEIDSVQIDVEWIQRLRAILRIADHVVLVVAVLLGLTVLLVIGNTIRLDIENRKEEITVTRLIGATNRYIRRPFIYGGLWLGLFGGTFSLIIVNVALLFLVSPVRQLANLYGSNFTLSGVNPIMSLQILAVSALLGIIGAWLAVGRFLWRDEAVD
ncbi:MAG TPA: permease-like cell division protein FtsX [Thiolinea sp.]|nr:permease-like cell division protein FtsX [Thiolinea sp.]